MKKRIPAEDTPETAPNSEIDLHAECDFSGVHPNQLEACMYYEYARESEGIIATVRDKRRAMRERMQNENLKVGDSFSMTFQGNIERIYSDFLYIILCNCGDFPLKPWQRLPQSETKKLATFNRDALRWTLIAANKDYPPLLLEMKHHEDKTALESWCNFRPEKLRLKGDGRVGFFYIDLGVGEENLVASFRDWLRKQDPAPKPTANPKRGRHGGKGYSTGYCREALNQLSALRLRHHTIKFEEANVFMKEMRERRKGTAEKSRFLVYSKGRRFKEACENAVKKFRFLFGGSGLPTSYPSGWRK